MLDDCCPFSISLYLCVGTTSTFGCSRPLCVQKKHHLTPQGRRAEPRVRSDLCHLH